jgi:hypothetical protein
MALSHGEGPAVDATGGAGGAAAALPCQYNDNCIEKRKSRKKLLARLTPNQRSVRHKVILAIELMVAKHGLERVGVLTLSFGVSDSGRGSFETWSLRQQAKVFGFGFISR